MAVPAGTSWFSMPAVMDPRMRWKVLDDVEAKASWDAWACQMPFASPFQSYAKGQVLRQVGTEPYFCACFDADGVVRAMALCTVKVRLWKAAIFACAGGPIGDPSLWAGLRQALAEAAGVSLVYLRVRNDSPDCAMMASALARTGWRPAPLATGTSRTIMLDLSRPLDRIKADLDSKWRYDLKAATSQKLVLQTNAGLDPKALNAIFSEMVATKQFASTTDEAKIRALVENRGANILLVSAADAGGNIHAFMVALVLGDQAVNFIAATSPEGRKSRAAFAIYWHAIEALQGLGVRDFDLGGIDPEGNPGVYRFKSRTGGVERKMVGELEIANWAPLHGLVSAAASARQMKFRLAKALKPPASVRDQPLPARWGAVARQLFKVGGLRWLVPVVSAAILIWAVD